MIPPKQDEASRLAEVEYLAKNLYPDDLICGDEQTRFASKGIDILRGAFRTGYRAGEKSLRVQKLIEAVKELLPQLKLSTDMPDAVLAVMVSPAESYRRAAIEIEKKDAIISTLRSAVAAIEGKSEANTSITLSNTNITFAAFEEKDGE